jgi:hypothetical protein
MNVETWEVFDENGVENTITYHDILFDEDFILQDIND